MYRIGDSKPAVKFDIIEKPNDWAKIIRQNDSMNQTQQFRFEYWTEFNEYAFVNAQFSKTFNRRKATNKHWMDLSIGSSACHIVISLIRKDSSLVVELYINDDEELFQALHLKKESIEKEIGCPLEWRELPEKKASRIQLAKRVDFEKRSEWTEQFDWLMDVTMKYKMAFKKYI